MAVRIFETDPDARPKPRDMFADDVVGRFRSGKTEGNRPISLSTWRVTTGDPTVAEFIASTYGGQVAEWEARGEDSLEVITDTARVDIIVDGSDAITDKLVLWGLGGVKIHECDGIEFLDEERRGQPCGCPALFQERKAAAKAGRGPKPDIQVKFRLAANPDLGMFRFSSSSWDMLRVLHEYKDALDAVDGPARCTLVLELVEFTPKSGPMAGRTVAYRRPVIKVHGPASTDA